MYRVLFLFLLIPGIIFSQEVEDKKSRFPLFETSDNYYQSLLNSVSKYDLKNLETNTELSDFGGYAIRTGDNGEKIN